MVNVPSKVCMIYADYFETKFSKLDSVPPEMAGNASSWRAAYEGGGAKHMPDNLPPF